MDSTAGLEAGEKSSSRRTLRLEESTKAALEKFKKKSGATTDTAAINKAVTVMAEIIEQYDLEEIPQAMWLYKQVQASGGQGPDLAVIVVNKADKVQTRLHVPMRLRSLGI